MILLKGHNAMTPNSWAFFDADTGNEITRGWQGHEYQARAFAQSEANERGHKVEFQPESDIVVDPSTDEYVDVPTGEVVEAE
jgi:hypothetical protein